ncbi:F-box only protein 9 isoform X2 [Nematostella vectensis]|uniref:F-box only protein 9 isoform X2 n=1 Tax=Nematostella vectensis TaxID=45351 RepID=UPI002076D67F|nr:F-box only protein 9 isoform X2 [Nematostella vectensis]
MSNKIKDELASFRQSWQQEIQQHTRTSPCDTNSHGATSGSPRPGINRGSLTIEEKASKLFQKGVYLERNGKHYDAIRFYRQAMQLVPDIEFKVNTADSLHGTSDDEEDEEKTSESEDENNFAELASMAGKFHQLSVSGHLCLPEFPPRMTHISVIPVELMVYILKWVISSELDFKSLEQIAAVSRGFYACARDPELWRLGCLRVWGLNTGLPVVWDGSFRLMYIHRPHVLTQGVYISKTMYMRQGEPSVNAFYRSMHVVEYYRYIRFNLNGSVVFLTTNEEPSSVIPQLSQPSNISLLKGHYRILGDKVVIVVEVPHTEHQCHGRSRRGKKAAPLPYLENAFHIDSINQTQESRDVDVDHVPDRQEI